MQDWDHYTTDRETQQQMCDLDCGWQKMSVGYTICTPENMTISLRNIWIFEKPGLNAFIFLVLRYDIHIYYDTLLHHSFFFLTGYILRFF